ncbi:MAG: DUF2007 domain-containing protein, partial [Acidimicrobiia bacterium]
MRRRDRHPDGIHYEPLVVVGDPTAANVLAALLRADGIWVRMHGEPFGPYPVGVGGLAQVEVWVASDRLDDARAVVEVWRADSSG